MNKVGEEKYGDEIIHQNEEEEHPTRSRDRSPQQQDADLVVLGNRICCHSNKEAKGIQSSLYAQQVVVYRTSIVWLQRFSAYKGLNTLKQTLSRDSQYTPLLPHPAVRCANGKVGLQMQTSDPQQLNSRGPRVKSK